MHEPPRSKYEVPIDPPSILPGCTSLMVCQIASTQSRSTNINKISLRSQNAIPDEMDDFSQIYLIRFYVVEIMLSEIKEKFSQYFAFIENSKVILFNASRSCLPETIFSVEINCHSRQVNIHCTHIKVNCNDLLSFSHCLTQWSQIEAIFKRVCTSSSKIKDVVLSLVSQTLTTPYHLLSKWTSLFYFMYTSCT
ncbi:uncharacterized protein LOC136092157 [Hydra vulgaris]|uniref:Uncharacterized protein LOC136092157 n=1 Tax=Hydra vulgaris TaxID=6087 RepID=A0ABM4DN15_HYDVU